jgi:hypothetical protein
MPSGKNWINFIYVNIGFTLCIVATYYLSSIKKVKANWPLYKCNPMYISLSDNMSKDFTYCARNMTTSFIEFLLKPLTFITGLLSSYTISGQFSSQNNFTTSIFNKIITSTKYLIDKIIDIMMNLTYALNGGIPTMDSNGSMDSNSSMNSNSSTDSNFDRSLGKCFYPETKIKLKNGNIVSIKDINLGDILENNSIVYSTMKIDNKNNKEDLYCIKGKGINGDNINVTGSHLVFDESKNKFVKVSEYHKADKSKVKTDWFSCLITSDHKIKIGSEIFWDWEDHFIKHPII